MKVFVSDSDNITIVAPIKLYSGVPTKIGGIICVPSTNAEIGDLVSVITSGVFEFNISTPVNIFDLVYLKILSESTYEISTKATDNSIPLGFATESSNGGYADIMLCNSITNANFNQILIKSLNDPTVKAAIKTAATT